MANGKLEKLIATEKTFTENKTEVGIACHMRLDKMTKWVEEAKKDWQGLSVYGIALESTHSGKRGRPKSYIHVKTTAFTPEEEIRLLRAELVKKNDWFVKWFGNCDSDST